MRFFLFFFGGRPLFDPYVPFPLGIDHFLLAVFADCLNALAVGLPFCPGFLIFSLDPAFILLRLAWIFS